MTNDDQRLACELLATADALRQCQQRLNALRRDNAHYPIAAMEHRAFDAVIIDGANVANALERLAGKLAADAEDDERPSRSSGPRCPRCLEDDLDSLVWQDDEETVVCERCGHRWQPNGEIQDTAASRMVYEDDGGTD
jgi:Zn ribbon nucleic-acid-binding protein